ncbi:DUF427 domain-containing protein [Pseudohalocynthiibacter aestuariivivens]|jgi:uncharacterized protein (DUF427 family)|uniref:DUF427 domain-containing protein n=1 Tax=Pseudohalocynthiibacter aestuariivivens TaxID=1591409 RepID=A0ABV5J9Z5_9RHOB|nr:MULTISPECIES: DUF427 domain-containing protein [Pseudohalocynthiibacter]MBS9716862.1 DUF427 domain-containing protein [Pseudohalocynthiibacter aestuariivivens]MCK0102045.1 DUF427 domain-containing protein [Pseudohalocynthiibacter sp. F2068]
MTDHIHIRKADGTWVVRAGGAVLAESKNALELSEGSYPPVIYFPRADIAMAFVEPSATTSHCPHKGDASYHSIQTKSVLIDDAAWSYENPTENVSRIKGHLAFYPEKVAVEQL